MKTAKEPVVIMALNTSYPEKETAYLASLGLISAPALGSYQGVEEQSHVILCRDAFEYQFILSVASTFKQESILYLTEDRKAFLYFLESDRVEELGHLKKVSKEEAEASLAYTKRLGNYYICK